MKARSSPWPRHADARAEWFDPRARLPSVPPLRVLLVCHRYQLQPASSQYHALHHAFDRHFALTRWFVEDRWPRGVGDIDGYDQYDAVVWFVRFRELKDQPAFRWGPYGGVRLMYDQDANQDFSQLGGSRHLGLWPEVFKRNEFQILACTGAKVRDHLESRGVHAAWLPKAVESGRFSDLGLPRAGIGLYGKRHYRSRAAMLDYLRHRHVAYEFFRCTYQELNGHLNRYQAGLVCNMEGVVRGPLASLINRVRPRSGIRLAEGPELMLKNFEIAAAGCVCFCDYIPEMDELGFVDGDTVVTYRSFDELVEKLSDHLSRPDTLRRIGSRAAALCAERHTWDRRMEQLDQLIRQMGAGRPPSA
jgi:hypothetical protein